MSLQGIQNHLIKAQEQLAQLVDEEQRSNEARQARGEREKYFQFEYEHGESGRGGQNILAYDAESAFRWFAYIVVEVHKMHPRNITYKILGDKE